MKIVIHDIPPSNNKFMGKSYNYHAYQNMKKKWHELIKYSIKVNDRPKQPYKKAVVGIKYYFKNRIRRDPDNYSGKMLLDPLVTEGILEDDSFKNIELQLSADVDKDNPRTEITITEVVA